MANIINFKKYYIYILLVLCIFISGLSSKVYAACIVKTDYEQNQSYNKDYTILVYMNGSNLESEKGQASEALRKMIKASGKNNFPGAFIVETGGTKNWQDTNLQNGNNLRLTIQDGKLLNIQKISDRNMGEFQTFADFINYGIATYPAKHYILIFWNHGGGSLRGFGRDDLYNKDSLTLMELSQAFKSSQVSDKQFDLIGFDACLMSTIETANVLSAYGHYMLASQEAEKQSGWNYLIFENLVQKSIRQIASDIIDDYVKGETNYSITLLNLDAIEPMLKILDKVLPDDLNKLINKILDKRARMLSFGDNIYSDTMQYNKPEMIDLDELFKIAGQKEKYNAVKKNLIIKHLAQGYNKPPCGISIFLPYDKDFSSESLDIYKKSEFNAKYINLVSNYYQLLQQDIAFYYNNIPQKENGNFYITIDNTNMFERAYNTVFIEEDQTHCSSLGYMSSDIALYKNKITSTFSGNWINILGQPAYILELENDEKNLIFLTPVELNRNSKTQKVYIKINYQKGNKPSYQILDVIPIEDGVARDIGGILVGDKVTPLYPVYEISSSKAKFLQQNKMKYYKKGVSKNIILDNILYLSLRPINQSYQKRFLLLDKMGNLHYSLPVEK